MRTFAAKQKATQQTPSAKPTIPGRVHFGQSRDANSILHLQRTIGNQAVQPLLDANAEVSEVGSGATTTARLAYNFGRIPVYAKAPGKIQTKLMVNTPREADEQETNHIVDQLMRMPLRQMQRTCTCDRGCTSGQAEQLGQEHQHLQAKGIQTNAIGETITSPVVHEILRSPDQPLDGSDASIGDTSANPIPTPALDPEAERTKKLASLTAEIDTERLARDNLKAKLAMEPEASTAARDSLQNQINGTEEALISKLDRKVKLLAEKIYALESLPALSASLSPELVEQRKQMLTARSELLALQRGSWRRRLVAIHAEDAKLPPSTSTQKGDALAKEKTRLIELLAHTAATRRPAGTWGTGPNQADYVVYDTYVKVGGTLPWRNNNPGNVQGTLTGSLGCNPQGTEPQSGKPICFAILPNWEAGVAATSRWWNTRSPAEGIEYALRLYAVGPFPKPKDAAKNEANLKTYRDTLRRFGIDTSKTLGRSTLVSSRPLSSHRRAAAPPTLVRARPTTVMIPTPSIGASSAAMSESETEKRSCRIAYFCDHCSNERWCGVAHRAPFSHARGRIK